MYSERREINYILLLLIIFPIQILNEYIPKLGWIIIGTRILFCLLYLAIRIGQTKTIKIHKHKVALSIVIIVIQQFIALNIHGTTMQNIIRLIDYMLILIAGFTYFSNLKRKDYVYLHKAVWYISTVYILITLCQSFYYQASDYQEVMLFIGSRADTVQTIFTLIVLLISTDYLLYKKIKRCDFVLLLLAFLDSICLKSGQGTVMLALIIITVALIYYKNVSVWKFITLKIGLILIAILNILIIFGYYQNIGVFNFVITEVLHKSITLTGRTNIYSHIPELISLSPLVGYGYGTKIVADYIGYIDSAFVSAHNSILELLLIYGAIGTVFFIKLIWDTLRQLYKHYEIRENGILIGAIWASFIGGLVNLMITSVPFLILLCFSRSFSCFSETTEK
ncbi:O-antigen ligase family protein [Clostridium sp. AWRP]|uniref:O-antigen ligase family protein n=1 Tax=Clostridium sp. AWRP TaxID=2212991 RepID=UPI000FDA3276|nr:O-antigen ligase family protein [Clostridium sp. AWRP]AZV55535.1 O-antigen ligase family protein [Clostridium sp. AWRP]